MFCNAIPSIMYIFTVFYLRFGCSDNFNMFARDSSLDDHVCNGTDLAFVHSNMGNLEPIRCLSTCAEDNLCMSVFFDKNDGMCNGCYDAYFSTGLLVEDSGTLYFALKSKNYGQKCYSDDICTGTNQVCWVDSCKCHMGYSYDPSTNTCVELCENYGDTFQKYEGYRVKGMNIINIGKITLDDCKALCLGADCRSMEYKNDTMQCHIADVVVLYPNGIDAYPAFDLHVRNCA